MKKITILSIFALLLCIAGCKQEGEFGDAIYMTGTLSHPVIRFAIDGQSTYALTVTATNKVSVEQQVTIKPSPELLEVYNASNNRNYVAPPTDSYSLDNGNLVIEKGKYVSSQAELSVYGEKLEKGKAYCLPITITSTKGEYGVLESSRTAYIVFNQIIISKVADINAMYYSVPTFMGEGADDVNAMNQMTMECKVYVNSFCNSSPYISSIIGIEERFLLRFGDVSCDKSQLQLAAGAVGGKKYPMTLDQRFATGRWYHLAAVYDGKTIIIYVDGKAMSSVNTAGGQVDLSWDYMDGFHIGRSERGRYLDGWVSEARVWNIARTASELQDGVCYVDPISKGLVAYWNFDGTLQDDGSVRDLTGHGHNAIPSSTPKWIDNQKCPF